MSEITNSYLQVMTSLNTYLNALKPFTNSIQKTATKLTDVLDDKLNKTQESLEK